MGTTFGDFYIQAPGGEGGGDFQYIPFDTNKIVQLSTHPTKGHTKIEKVNQSKGTNCIQRRHQLLVSHKLKLLPTICSSMDIPGARLSKKFVLPVHF